MFAKTEVNGLNAHPLFKALKQAAPGLLGTQGIKWNFTKFLVDRNRNVVRRYAPTDRPESARRRHRGRACLTRRARCSDFGRNELSSRQIDRNQVIGRFRGVAVRRRVVFDSELLLGDDDFVR